MVGAVVLESNIRTPPCTALLDAVTAFVVAFVSIIFVWRRGRDSNPRWRFRHSGFQDRRIRPLCHPSGPLNFWQGERDSNPQPAVLETAALPIELPPLTDGGCKGIQFRCSQTLAAPF